MTDTKTKKRPLDWLWQLVALVCAAIVISVTPSLWAKFSHGGVDFHGLWWMGPPALFAMLLGAGSLSEVFKAVASRTREGLGHTERRPERVLALLGVVSVAWTTVVWLRLPEHSLHYNNKGIQALEAGRVDSAEVALQRAVQLDPLNPAAHYNLAGLYEDLLRFDEAGVHYRLALAGGLPFAGNNLGRLLLRRRQPNEAAVLLQGIYAGLSGLSTRAEEGLRFSVAKNLGWARLQQGRLTEALPLLEEAIQLEPDRAAGHCLRAKALAGLARDVEAESAWVQCLERANLHDPDEDVWIGEAREYLRSVEARP